MYEKIHKLKIENYAAVIRSIFYIGAIIFFANIEMHIFFHFIITFSCISGVYSNVKKISINSLMIKKIKLEQERRENSDFFNERMKEIYDEFYRQHQQYQSQTQYKVQSDKLKDAYTLFKLSSTTSVEDIKSKYRELAFKWHPDKWTTDTIENQNIAKRNFQKMQAAYDLIKKDKGIN